MYARVQIGESVAPGVAYCPACAPAVGDDAAGLGPVVGHDTAHDRYTDWYNPDRKAFYRAWLHDALSLEPADIAALMALWEFDRAHA